MGYHSSEAEVRLTSSHQIIYRISFIFNYDTKITRTDSLYAKVDMNKKIKNPRRRLCHIPIPKQETPSNANYGLRDKSKAFSGISFTHRHYTWAWHLHFNKQSSIALEELLRDYTRTHRRKTGLACILSKPEKTNDAANSRGDLIFKYETSGMCLCRTVRHAFMHKVIGEYQKSNSGEHRLTRQLIWNRQRKREPNASKSSRHRGN